jgi:chemotaxis protein histidine kinase CheA
MSEGPGFLEFFILEASDYVEQLDGLLLGGASSGPDADAMQRVARALRGTATMAKLPTFADVAAGVERVGRAMQEGALHWDPALGGALVAAVDDLKTLLHRARSWSSAEDDRASSRTADLARFAPPRPFTPPRDQGNQRAAVAGSAFLATEAANIAAGLELLTTRAGASDTAVNLLRRVRALRGVAGVKEVIPLAEVLEATENAVRGFEHGESALGPEARRLFETAAEYLRLISSALRFGGDVDAPSAARDAFQLAQDAWTNREGDVERVVPIASLFYVDGGPGIVEPAANPPTSAADRFRLELVSHGEHLHQLIAAARRTTDAGTRERARRDLTRALHGLETIAQSFGESKVAELVRSHARAAASDTPKELDALDELASVLAQPGAHGERLSARLETLTGDREASAAAVAAAPRPAEPVIAVEEVAVEEEEGAVEEIEEVHEREEVSATELSAATVNDLSDATAPSLASTAALIDLSIAALESLTSEPWLPPVHVPEEAVVPIESLLYRGRAALDRAVEIRDELRRAAPSSDAAALEELFDLLELAQAE